MDKKTASKKGKKSLIQFTAKEHAALSAYTKKMGISYAEAVRRAVDFFYLEDFEISCKRSKK